MNKTYTIGIDIGGTNFRMGIVDNHGNISHFSIKPSNIFEEGNVIDILYQEITDYLEKVGYTGKIKAIAIGIPSLVSKDKKVIFSSPNLKGFDNIVFGNTLSDILGFPVYIDRDVNFLLQNDILKLNLDRSKTILGFYIGTGFGNSIYINGGFYCGKNGAAGELGHIPLYDIYDVCTCGKIGCSEVRCSGKYLEFLVKKHFPDVNIKNVFKEKGNDPIIIKYVKDLAIPIATEINILDPDYIILAGGVLYMQDFPKDLLVKSIHEHTRKPYPEANLEIIFSEHNQESGVYGSGNFAHGISLAKQGCK